MNSFAKKSSVFVALYILIGICMCILASFRLKTLLNKTGCTMKSIWTHGVNELTSLSQKLVGLIFLFLLLSSAPTLNPDMKAWNKLFLNASTYIFLAHSIVRTLLYSYNKFIAEQKNLLLALKKNSDEHLSDGALNSPLHCH